MRHQHVSQGRNRPVVQIRSCCQNTVQWSRPVLSEKLSQLFRFIEGTIKHVMPTIVAEIAYQSLGSEKLVDFIDEQIRSEKTSAIRTLLCSFMLLEIDSFPSYNQDK
ncbi:hypothetical protein RN69_38565 [Bradyrhizobium japonicum]|nr:hypothetical protein RN69_38565 [Bradyrhizobium japonicum]